MYGDQLDGLLALKAVAKSKNFTKAAKQLGVSPSAISQTIKLLEHRMGAPLLTRTTRSTSLTETGERFLASAGPALDQVLAALEDVGRAAGKPAGLLRLNLPRQVYPFYLAPLVASFTKKFPDIAVELFFEDQQSDIFASGFDAGIRLSDILAKDVVALKLVGPVRFVIAASPHYLSEKGRPRHPQELLHHNCIRYRLGQGLYDKWEFEHRGREFQVQVKGSLILNDSLLGIEAAVGGAGIVYSTQTALKDRVCKGELEILLQAYSCESDGFYLYYPKQSQVLPKLRAFIDHVKATKA